MQHWLNPRNLTEATEVQREMAALVRTEDDLPDIRLIGGADVSCNFRDPAKMIYAAVVSLDLQLEVREKSSIAARQEFPYIPGFLAFREAPAIVESLARLKRAPDLLMVDGQGISHPRGLGIASHLGVLCDLPTIGVGKTILIGEPAGPLGERVGDKVSLTW
ncbi:MAG: endonuclease V, partial [Parachlamydia sp.]|nr:endonuclease V [Parachlamydia sp.]